MARSDEPADTPGGRWRGKRRWALILAGPVVIAIVALALVLTSGRSETTENAYVQIAKAPVSASIPGRVIAVYVAENQPVRAGQPLFRLDSGVAEAEVAAAKAELARAELDVAGLKADYRRYAAETVAAQSQAAYAAREAARQQALLRAGVSSRQQADAAANAVTQAREALAATREAQGKALAALGGNPDRPVSAHPDVLAARAAVERESLRAGYSLVRAPTDGVVTRVAQLQPGAYVNAAQTVFWLLAGKPWVEANFKENQLAHMRVGQPVTIKVDAWPGEALKGHIASFAPGTGAIFSALPPQNATGNWVKATQRLPVRIDFDAPPPAMAGRAGLSATVKVDVRAPGQPQGKAPAPAKGA